MANVNTGSRSRIMDTNKQNTPNFIENCLKCHATSSAEKLNECFKSFDMNKDGKLDLKEFDHFLGCLFSKNGKPYPITEKQRKIIHNLLDENKDGKIDYEEFRIIWYHWLKQILDPVTALLVVDVQNDFITGSLAIKDCPAGQDGEAIIPVINKMLDTVKFDCVVYSYDWHPPNHISFVDNVKSWKVHNSSKVPADIAKLYDTVTFDGDPIKVQKLWPAHCIQNSWGSQLHPDLKVVENACHVNKGKNPEIDSYSAFWDNNKLSQTELVSELTKRGVTDVYVCGVAYDVCVGSTALHSIEHGFRTLLIDDASKGVSEEGIRDMRNELQQMGAIIVNSDEVQELVSAKDRRPELGVQAALNVALARKLVKRNSQSRISPRK